MQQWLDLVPMAGALLNLAAAMTNLAITIMNRTPASRLTCRGAPAHLSRRDRPVTPDNPACRRYGCHRYVWRGEQLGRKQARYIAMAAPESTAI